MGRVISWTCERMVSAIAQLRDVRHSNHETRPLNGRDTMLMDKRPPLRVRCNQVELDYLFGALMIVKK